MDINQIIKKDKEVNFSDLRFRHFLYIQMTQNGAWLRYIYLKNMRRANYYKFIIKQGNKNILIAIKYFIASFKKNALGNRLGFEIETAQIGQGLILFHNNVVINEKSILGENVRLHGYNCIGNNGKADGCPKIGNNVDIGFGAVILGNITIADNTTIAANAVIVKDIITPGETWGGIPGKKIK